MSRSRPSSEPTRTQPEFFLDRGLGRGVGEDLRALGWIAHRITDHFPDDAQKVADEEWIEYGIRRGWTPLCKDGRIKGRDHERKPLETYSAVLFYLDNQKLKRHEMVSRLQEHRQAIERRVRQGGPATYAVRATKVDRTWP
jgi:hypothetical protein